MKTTPTLFILGLACASLSYLSIDSFQYDNCTNCIYGFLFFGAVSIGLLSLALSEILEQRTEI
jgi:hypothetical protein